MHITNMMHLKMFEVKKNEHSFSRLGMNEINKECKKQTNKHIYNKMQRMILQDGRVVETYQ